MKNRRILKRRFSKEANMANFRPKRPITQDSEYFYADTLENFLKRRPLKKRGKLDISSLEMSKTTNGGTNGKTAKLLEMQGKFPDSRRK
jgi:hypothetical protein